MTAKPNSRLSVSEIDGTPVTDDTIPTPAAIAVGDDADRLARFVRHNRLDGAATS